MEFAQTLDMLMKSRGWTSYRLAKEMHCSQSTIAHWLNGESKPSRMSMKRLNEVLGLREPENTEQQKTALPEEDGDLAEIRDAIKENPALRALFEASVGLPASRIYEAAAQLARWKEGDRVDS